MTHKIAVFNHKGGVSKTTTVFHLGWMLTNLGKRVLLVDADSQYNLTKIIVGDYEDFYEKNPNRNIKSALAPAFESRPTLIDTVECYPVRNNDKLFLLPGSFDITEYEVQLGVSFQLSNAFTTMKNLPGSFNYLLEKTAQAYNVDYVIIDLNPSLGAINQDLLISSDYFLIPCSPDYFSKMAIESLSKKLPAWEKWAKQARDIFEDATYPMPLRTPKFLGYTINNFTKKYDKPASAFRDIIAEIDEVVKSKLVPKLAVVDMLLQPEIYSNEYCLAEISNFNTLGAKYQELGIPVFELTDKQIGSSGVALEIQTKSRDSFKEIFEKLANRIADIIDYAESHTTIQA